MGATTAQAADVNAAETAEETKSTATTDTSSEETKTTESTESSQEQADKEIAADLDKEEKKKAKEDGDVADDTDETQESEETQEEDAKDDKKSEEESDEAESEEERAKGAEARKQALQSEIRELVSKRNELRAEVEQANTKAYRTETAEELAEKGLSEEEANAEIMRQEAEMREFNIHVADLNSTLNLEALQVMQDFPVFDPDSKDYDKDLSNRVRGLYEQAAQPKVDPRTGLVIQSNLPPYEFYKAFAETHQTSSAKSRVEGRIEGEKASDKNLAAAETPSSTAPRKKAEDPFLKGLLSKED